MSSCGEWCVVDVADFNVCGQYVVVNDVVNSGVRHVVCSLSMCDVMIVDVVVGVRFDECAGVVVVVVMCDSIACVIVIVGNVCIRAMCVSDVMYCVPTITCCWLCYVCRCIWWVCLYLC